ERPPERLPVADGRRADVPAAGSGDLLLCAEGVRRGRHADRRQGVTRPHRGEAVKITVIGGGSTYTPELIEGFARRADALDVDEVVLHDIAPERLEVVGGFARRILARTGHPGRLTVTTDRAQALEGTAAVLVQLRVGGQQARLSDETLPGRYGL